MPRPGLLGQSPPQPQSCRLRRHITSAEGHLGNFLFDRLDRNCIAVKTKRAAFLAGCGADAPGNLREAVGGIEHPPSRFPVAVRDVLLGIGHGVVQRALVLTERDPAVHAAGRLFTPFSIGINRNEFVEVLNSLLNRFMARFQTGEFEKASIESHFSSPPS